MAVILASAYLHDIGIHEAERKYQSTASVHQEQEGPPIARSIMENLGASPPLIDEVCDIIRHHHHPRKEETLNFKVLYDADLISQCGRKTEREPKFTRATGTNRQPVFSYGKRPERQLRKPYYLNHTGVNI